MKSFITELYYGNIDPQCRGFRKDSYLKTQMAILADCEEVLTQHLIEDDMKTFLSYANETAIVLGESELDAFIVGFRLGAKFSYDTFVNDEAPYKDVLKDGVA